MEEIAKLLVELLRTHNRVSLPGMGAFVASPQAAIIDKGRIMPPTKKVAFVKAETWNDGLLEQLYAKRHGISAEEAEARLHRIIADIRLELDSGGKATLPGLGTLRQTAARDVSFGLAKNLNLQRDSYGLDEVKIDSDKAPKKTKRKKIAPASRKNNISLLVLLFIVLAAIAALALFLLLSRARDKDSIESLILTQNNPQPTLSDASPAQAADENYPDEAEQPALPEAEQPALPEADRPTPAAEQQLQQPQQQAPPRCEFCTVVASFNTLEGARIKAQRYKDMGYKSRVVNGGNSRYRVMLGCYSTLDAAKKGLSETFKFVKDAWILEVCE
ncbi:MAG: SPOR domain-containing protein [Prevotellaceae bacterium]|jgi:nucleoid DNA-binding protein|nr:SPOR domain-containing protein [Prevotellaceae bacterium]